MSGLGKNHFARVKQRDKKQKEAPLTPQDHELLALLKDKYAQLGRTPTQSDVSAVSIIKIKDRFGFWKNTISAAGLPPLNDPEQVKLREKAAMEK